MRLLTTLLFHGTRNARLVDIGLAVLRIITGLGFALVFEKILPREGVWGPQPWFVEDVAEMGFPAPLFFAWAAALAEFVGGILLVVGLASRPAALLNVVVTFVAAFLFHGGDVDDGALLAIVFLGMTTALTLTGPGRYSLDHLIARRLGLTSPSEDNALPTEEAPPTGGTSHAGSGSVVVLVVLALILFAGCTATNSTVTIGPGERFEVGGAQRSSFWIELENLSDGPVDVAVRDEDGQETVLVRLHPGERAETSVDARTAALLVNEQRQTARVAVRIHGGGTLSMGYADARSRDV